MIVSNLPSDYVRTLVCGLGQKDRDRRLLFMLKAFIDESSSRDANGIFVMGGFVAFVSEWERLSEQWEHVLKSDPVVPFYRTTYFRDPRWREEHGLDRATAMCKTEALAYLLTYPPLLFSVCVSVDKQEYRDVIETSGILQKRIGRTGRLWLKTPYSYCFHNLIAITLRKLVGNLDIRGDVVDFVFDRNEPHFDAANKMLRAMRQQGFGDIPQSWASTLGDAVPGNDETLNPLQMADLLAGRLKDHCSNNNPQFLRALLAVSGAGDGNITFHARKHHIEKLIHKMVKDFPV